MRWPWQPKKPGTPKLECPVCQFTHFEPIGQTFNAHIVDGEALLIPSGARVGCSRCLSTLRFTAEGLKLVKKQKAADPVDDEEKPSTDPNDEGGIDTDLRLPRHERRRLRAASS